MGHKTKNEKKKQKKQTKTVNKELIKTFIIQTEIATTVETPLTGGDLEDPLTTPRLGDDPEDSVWVGLGSVATARTTPFGRRNATIPEGIALFLEAAGQVRRRGSIPQYTSCDAVAVAAASMEESEATRVRCARL